MFDSIWGDIKGTFNQQKNVVPKLITANIIAFFLLNGGQFNLTYLACTLTGFDFNKIYHFFALPIHIEEVAWKPWTLFTYGFLHDGFWHIFYNLLFLYVFGNILQEYLGNKKILTVFFAGIVVSGLVEIIAFQVSRFAVHYYPIGYTVGASGGVMAILVAAATLLPDYIIRLIFFDVRLKYIALFYFAIDFFSLGSWDNWGGHVAHLAGAMFGFFYIKDIYRKSYIDNFIENLNSLFKPKSKLKVVYKKDNYYSQKLTGAYKRNQKPNQQEIDDILDKISQSGYDSLTKTEKELLFAASNDD